MHFINVKKIKNKYLKKFISLINNTKLFFLLYTNSLICTYKICIVCIQIPLKYILQI